MADTPRSSDILEKLYKTGEYSDLTIISSTRTFNVHKNVICTASPYFAAACRNDWQEARTGIIHLPEDGMTIDIIIKWCYGILPDMTECPCKFWAECIRHHLPAVVAADKYQLPDLKDALLRDIEYHEGNFELVGYVEFGCLIYEGGWKNVLGPKFMRSIVEWIGNKMYAVMDDLEIWQKLEKCPELLKDVVRMVAQSSDLVEEKIFFEDPDYLQVPEQ